MRTDVGTTRLQLITSVPAEGVALSPPTGLHVLGFETQAAGTLVIEETNAETPGTPTTFSTTAHVFRGIRVKKIHTGTTALPILVYFGPRR